MYRQQCSFGCKNSGPEHEDPFEAAARACEHGFVRVEVPDPETAGRSRVRFFCAHCAKYVRTHFLSEPRRMATANDVLVPENEDEDFENDQGW